MPVQRHERSDAQNSGAPVEARLSVQLACEFFNAVYQIKVRYWKLRSGGRTLIREVVGLKKRVQLVDGLYSAARRNMPSTCPSE